MTAPGGMKIALYCKGEGDSADAGLGSQASMEESLLGKQESHTPR
jgi:hypothetical protein